MKHLLVVFAAAVLGAQPCKLPPLGGLRAHPGMAESRFCAPAKLPAAKGSAQVLFDDSGSMSGYKAALPALALWSEQALSQVRQHGMTWTRTRGCYFSTARSLAGCTSPLLAPSAFRGAGATSLHLAIDSAAQYDLTVLFTDGASASGGGSGDCAGGVDAACVARAMARVLEPRPGEPQGAAGGIWIVPLVALYDGPLYTEQPLDPLQLNPEGIAQRVAAETSTNAIARDPKRDAKGLVVYQYTGPRAFLALILAKNATVGRAFLAALKARMQFSQILGLTSMKAYQSGIAAMRPIEVYPGAAMPVSFAQSRVLEPVCLTLDARVRPPNQLQVTCANPADEAVVRLDARTEPASPDCIEVLQLPRLAADQKPAGTLNAIRDYTWSGSATDPARPLSLSLRVRCSKNWPLAPGQCQTAAIWELRRDYAGTASALFTGKPASPALNAVRSLSVPEVASAPHRVFQLQETLEKFYRNALSVTPAADMSQLARVDICRP
jgi:hypothetical protein